MLSRFFCFVYQCRKHAFGNTSPTLSEAPNRVALIEALHKLSQLPAQAPKGLHVAPQDAQQNGFLPRPWRGQPVVH
jgi:hypothetical protein